MFDDSFRSIGVSNYILNFIITENEDNSLFLLHCHPDEDISYDAADFDIVWRFYTKYGFKSYAMLSMSQLMLRK
jgi:hypothetical protein